MSRIRTVKPELFKHEGLFDAEQLYRLPLRLAFIALFTCCDREGRFRWRPRRLKLDILPYDTVDMAQVLEALEATGFIKKYEHQGESYGCIPSWSRHQQINHHEAQSEIPAPNELNTSSVQKPAPQSTIHASTNNPLIIESTSVNDASLTREPRVDDASLTRAARVVGASHPLHGHARWEYGIGNRNMEQEGEEEREGKGEKQNTIVASEMRPLGEMSVSPPILQSGLSTNLHSMLHASTRELQNTLPPSGRGTASRSLAAAISLKINPPPEVSQTQSPSEGLQPKSLPTPELNTALMALRAKHLRGLDTTPTVSRKSASQEPLHVNQVFEHWKTVMQHPNANLDVKRKALIKKALQCGYEVQQLCEAITGCSYTPHNMGFNDRGQRYDGLHVIFRDADQIDRFIHHYQYPPHPMTEADRRTEANVQTLQRWANKKLREEKLNGG